MKKLTKPVYCIPGNHDNPELLNHYFPNTPVNTVTSIKHQDSLLIFVNTQVLNQQYGYINAHDINEISRLLDTNRKLNAVIVLHHPPIAVNSKWMDTIGLKNADKLMKAVHIHKNVKLMLFGHVHQEINSRFKHIQLFATPSSCYQFKPNTDTIQYDDLSPAYRHVKIDQTGAISSQIYRL